MDSRPVVIVEEPNKQGEFVCVYLSADMSMYKGPPDQMLFQKLDPDYAKLGLPRDECFADRNELHYHSVADIVKRYGELQGELLKRFLRWV